MRAAARRPIESRAAHDSAPRHDVWQWIAVAVLLLCWVAEATLCAANGY